jgi:outer membrane protein OmpA-like peptidoglycan-associated protein
VNGADTLRVKAVHIPCNRDVTTLTAKAPSITAPVRKDTIVTKIKPTLAIVTDTAYTITLACVVKDSKKNTPLQVKPSVIDISTNEEVPVTFSEEGGEWRGTVSRGKTYKIKCSTLGYKSAEQSVAIEKAFTRAELSLEPLKAGDNFIMKSIYFYPNTYALKKESAPDLQRLLSYLNENTNVTIEIQGHTNGDHHIAKNKAYSSLGEEWNFQGSAKNLSQKRAEVIRSYLVSYGIQPERLIPKGYGGKKPIILDPQDNEEGQMNIRVEIAILKS